LLRAAFGFDGANTFLTSYVGQLVLHAAGGLILPSADNASQLGYTATGKLFKSAHLKEELWVAGVQVVDTSGRVILETQGSGFYPMYVNPNGRYTPAAHNHPYAPIGSTMGVSFLDGNGIPRTMLFSDGALTGVI
jgi:hypothetical protein